jgi:aminoglycoside phosphotransferase (APT) family kinase protein
MTAGQMHVDEVDTDASLVRRLLVAQFPQRADLAIEPVPSAGTDNAIYRLGDDMAVRLPRIERATRQVDKEHAWLPRLAPHLPLAVPVPLARGVPGEGYPWHWSINPWLAGENVTIERLADPRQAATDLARFIAALQRIDPSGGPPPGEHNFGRGVPLAQRDSRTREAIRALDGMLDTAAVTAAWDAALQAPAWHGPPVWIHGDVSAGNLLAVQGRLSAVIDFGGLGVGDPACDLMIAWTLFSGESRETFRAALAVDDATWARGRAWALSWALIFIPYYLHTNPVGVSNAWRAIEEVLADYSANGWMGW